MIQRYLYLAAFLFLSNTLLSQSVQQEKMSLLSFMVGEWIGTSKSFEDGKVTKEVSAYEKVTYDLDSSIIVIQLNTESLQLHTIIYFDTDDNTYYYYPFSKRGVNRATATFEDGRLIVQSSAERRYIFGPIPNGGFREYGEKLINGKWTKYFQDDFSNTQ